MIGMSTDWICDRDLKLRIAALDSSPIDSPADRHHWSAPTSDRRSKDLREDPRPMTMGSLAEVADPGNQVTTWMRLIHTRSHYRFR